MFIPTTGRIMYSGQLSIYSSFSSLNLLIIIIIVRPRRM